MIKQLQIALNSQNKLAEDDIPGPKTKAVLMKHPIALKFFELGYTNLEWLAYIFATAWHETAFTLLPITEYGSQAYLQSKAYWPYIGRGYPQLTWKDNYAKFGLENNPEKASEPETSAMVIVDGMAHGKFTGRSLVNYFDVVHNDPVGARAIINGTDKAAEIAEYYHQFLALLKV